MLAARVEVQPRLRVPGCRGVIVEAELGVPELVECEGGFVEADGSPKMVKRRVQLTKRVRALDCAVATLEALRTDPWRAAHVSR